MQRVDQCDLCQNELSDASFGTLCSVVLFHIFANSQASLSVIPKNERLQEKTDNNTALSLKICFKGFTIDWIP